MPADNAMTHRVPGAPSLSIAVNNYNYANFLGEALDSALAQMVEGDELIVVDDGSTDDSARVLESYADRPGVTILRQENGGQISAVRAGLEAASGDVILLLDSDDLYRPGYLDRLRQLYAREPDIAMAFTTPRLFGPDAGGIRAMRGTLQKLAFAGGRLGSTRWATLLFFEFVGTPTSGISMRSWLARELLLLPAKLEPGRLPGPMLQRLLGVNPRVLSYTSVDGVLVRAASALDAARYLDPEPGFDYRIHGNNAFAALPRRGQYFVRWVRKNSSLRAFRDTYDLPLRPGVAELRREIEQRAWPVDRGRRLSIRLRYALGALRARGGWRDRLGLVRVAFEAR